MNTGLGLEENSWKKEREIILLLLDLDHKDFALIWKILPNCLYKPFYFYYF
jgi:hypothetical protein